jgi:hypothetical protein
LSSQSDLVSSRCCSSAHLKSVAYCGLRMLYIIRHSTPLAALRSIQLSAVMERMPRRQTYSLMRPGSRGRGFQPPPSASIAPVPRPIQRHRPTAAAQASISSEPTTPFNSRFLSFLCAQTLAQKPASRSRSDQASDDPRLTGFAGATPRYHEHLVARPARGAGATAAEAGSLRQAGLPMLVTATETAFGQDFKQAPNRPVAGSFRNRRPEPDAAIGIR